MWLMTSKKDQIPSLSKWTVRFWLMSIRATRTATAMMLFLFLVFTFFSCDERRVGVGDQADFGPMEELDGDDVRIKDSTGKPASRDIVQFVPMKDFRHKGFHALAREVR